ncbi:MAG: GNAT family N-acetyltransferase [Dongiaceae bacterium]
MTQQIRLLDRQETARAVEWAAEEGWNPGLNDADAFFASDPGGYWGLFEDGALLATISVVRYGGAFAFVGLYICRPDRRGEGLGYQLWESALGNANAGTLGLDGVVDQQLNYRKAGFALAHRNVRYGGTPVATAPDDPRLTGIGPEDVGAVLAYEAAARLFPAERRAFLRAWLDLPGSTSVALRDRSGAIEGYGTIRPCHSGFKIGPLFAAHAGDAMCLAQALIVRAGRGPVFLDPPEPNVPAVDLAKRLGLEPVFETARMYRGPAPDLAVDRIFGITSFELG